MSMGGADAKFPGQSTEAIPPPWTRENPGQVYPKSDPKAAPAESVPGTGGEHEPKSVTGNPFMLKEALSKLDIALNEVVAALEHEEGSSGSSAAERSMLQRFKSWQLELTGLGRRVGTGRDEGTSQEGGLFTD